MFAKKIKSIAWNDDSDPVDSRRCFNAAYIFDDGFSSEKKCSEQLNNLGYNPENFAYVFFCNMWYAVFINSYYSFIVISKENVIYKEKPFSEGFNVIPLSQAKVKNLPKAGQLQKHRRWQNGILCDLLQIDPDLSVRFEGKEVPASAVLFNNIVITFGREFFRTEICIKTDFYVNRVFPNYFNINSMRKEREHILMLRKEGYQYYNPFTGAKSKNYQESRKKADLVSKSEEVPETIIVEKKNVSLEIQIGTGSHLYKISFKNE